MQPRCKFCGSEKVVRAGIHYVGRRRQRWLCKDCGHIFLEEPARGLEDVKSILQRGMGELREKYKVRRIGVFGSYLRGAQREGSDIDILVDFSGPVGWEFIDLAIYLEEKLGRKVDLVTPGALKEGVRERVLGEVVFL